MKKSKLYMIIGTIMILPLTCCEKSPRIKANEMPIIEINTEDKVGINSKKEYVAAKINLKNVDDSTAFSDVSAGIRGRGNFTWTLEKKPYRIKFDQKENMFQNYTAKSWVLLANYTDKSLLKNYMALYFANKMDGMDWNPTAAFVEVYLNKKYQGVYLLCDQIEVDRNRINVETEGIGTDTGFLIEKDRYVLEEDGVEEGTEYFFVNNEPYAVKAPERSDENFSSEKIDFIQSYIQEVNDAILLRNFEKLQELCNIDSIIDFYIVGQIFASNEFNAGSSFYMHKEVGEKLRFGPVWDFDLSLGYRTVSLASDYINDDYNTLLKDCIWFNILYEIDEFRNMFLERISNIHDILDDLIAEMDNVQQKYKVAFNNNFLVWDVKEDMWFEPKAVKEFDSQNDYYLYAREFLVKRIDCFKNKSYI